MNINSTRILALIWKEFLAVWRDPKSRISLLVPPVVQLFIFTFAATLDVKDVSMGIVNMDSGRQSYELVQRFRGSPTFSKIAMLDGMEQVGPFIDNQRGMMVLAIDPEFSRNIEERQPALVELILDGRKSNSTQIVAGYTESIISQFNTDLARQLDMPEMNVRLIPRNWFNPNLHYYWYNVPSLVALLSMLTALIVTSLSIAREREIGTFDQLLVSPLTPVEILIGKMVPGIVIGTLEGTLILTVGVLVFQVPFTGSLPLYYLSLVIFITSIVGVGLFISSLCSTQQQAILGTFIFMVPSVLLSGYATPIENMPEWLQPVSYLIPFRYMLVISKGLFLKAMPAWIVLKNIWPMVLIGIFTLTGANLLFRRRLQ